MHKEILMAKTATKKTVTTKDVKESKAPASKELVAKAKSVRTKVVNVEVEDLDRIIANKQSNSQDVEFYDEYRHMFLQLKKNIRVFEKELRFNKSTRNVYALISMYSQQREIMADVRAITDHTENISRIMTSLIQPLFSNITQSNLDIFYHIRKLVIETSKDDQTQYALKRLEDLMREQARYLQDKYETAGERLTDIITQGK